MADKNNSVKPENAPAVNNNAKAISKNKKTAVRSSELRPARAVKVVNVKSEAKTPFPWSIIIVAVVLTTLFLFMMMNYAEVDKYRSEIASLNSKISTLQKQEDDLNVRLKNKNDYEKFAQYAEDELGMVKSVPNEKKHYITIQQDDRTEMYTYDDGEEGGIGFLLTGLGEVFRDFLK